MITDDDTNEDILEFDDEDLLAANILPKEILAAAAEMPLATARFLIDTFYTYQDERIGKAAQVREAQKAKEPTTILSHFLKAAELHDRFRAWRRAVGAAMPQPNPEYGR